MSIISLQVDLPNGKDGFDRNPKNPLSRAYAALLEKGRPHLSHTLCYLNSEDDSNSAPTDLRWFGVFLHSAGERILFFPGLAVPIDWVETAHGSASPTRHSLQLDHISAEPIRQRWHFTGIDSVTHVAAGRTPEHPGSGSYFWFGISLSNAQSFLPVYKHTLVVHTAPQADLARRRNELSRLQSSASYARVNCDTQLRLAPEESFLHIGVLFTKKSRPVYRGMEWLVPDGSPYVSPPLPQEVPQAVRNHQIPLSTEWDVSVGTIVLPGKLSVAAAFTGAETL